MTTNAEIFSRLGSSSTTATVMLINSGDIVGNASFQVGRASGNASLTWNEIGGYWTAGLVGSETKLIALTSGGIMPSVDGSNVTNITGANVNNAVLTTGSYSDPAWITALSAAKLTTGTLPNTAIPVPTTSALGGVQANTAVTSQWIRAISTAGVPTLSQPAFTDVSGTLAESQLPAVAVKTDGSYANPAWITSLAGSKVSGAIPSASLPAPTTSALGGVQAITAVSHQWVASISTAGVPALTQPAFTDVSGTITAAQLSGSTALLSSDNLASVANKNTALTNLGATGGTIAGPSFTGLITQESTIIGLGVTTSPTINKASGRVRMAAGATSLPVTNTLVSANSIIQLTLATNDATAAGLSAVATTGGFTIYLKTAATAEVGINFTTIN